MESSRQPWPRSPARAELIALYAETDALLEGWVCGCTLGESPTCCHFDITGREPYPTAVELEEVVHGMRTAGMPAMGARRLPLIERAPCPLLLGNGRCRIYASRPFGCRTFFCQEAEGPSGARAKSTRAAINAIGRKIADLSSRFAPRDPHPRPLVKAIAQRYASRRPSP